jgi:hypothetical protein
MLLLKYVQNKIVSSLPLNPKDLQNKILMQHLPVSEEPPQTHEEEETKPWQHQAEVEAEAQKDATPHVSMIPDAKSPSYLPAIEERPTASTESPTESPALGEPAVGPSDMESQMTKMTSMLEATLSAFCDALVPHSHSEHTPTADLSSLPAADLDEANRDADAEAKSDVQDFCPPLDAIASAAGVMSALSQAMGELPIILSGASDDITLQLSRFDALWIEITHLLAASAGSPAEVRASLRRILKRRETATHTLLADCGDCCPSDLKCAGCNDMFDLDTACARQVRVCWSLLGRAGACWEGGEGGSAT